MEETTKEREGCQEAAGDETWEELAETVGERCFGFLRPFLRQLDTHVDVRLVRTLANLVPVIIRRRNRGEALLLSQMGDDLEEAGKGPAGTKRIENLLRSPNWHAEEVWGLVREEARAVAEAEAARVPEGRALLIADGSVAEKPESEQAAGLAPVISPRARRLRRPRPTMGTGYWRGKPGPPTVVPGWSWLSLTVTGWADRAAKRPVALANWLWYRRVKQEDPARAALDRPIPTADQETALLALLRPALAVIGADHLLFVGDREFGSRPWIAHFLALGLPAVVRFKKGNHLRPEDAPSVGDPLAPAAQLHAESVPAWKLTQNLLFRQTKTIVNPRNPKQPLPVRFGARPVRLPDLDAALWLVWVRVGKGGRRRRDGEPWRLLTTLAVATKEDVWRVVEAYAARWQIEQTIRFGKSALGIESVRVRGWEPRQKLLALVALAYAFLVSLLGDASSPFVQRLLAVIHRRGRQAHDAWRPLYRLQMALAKLWSYRTPSFQGVP